MEQRTDTRTVWNRLWRLTPLLLLAMAASCFIAAGGPRFLSLEAIREHDEALVGFVRDHRMEGLAIFAVTYAVATACCMPGVTILTLAGGYLFGTWLGGGAAVIGGATGAISLYLAIRTCVGSALRERAVRRGGRLKAAIDGVGAGAFGYILALRLFPLAPFWLVSAAAALAGAPLAPYGLATLVGIIPITLIYSGIGAGIGKVVAHGGNPGPGLLAQPSVIVPLMALGLLSATMAVVLRIRARRATLP